MLSLVSVLVSASAAGSAEPPGGNCTSLLSIGTTATEADSSFSLLAFFALGGLSSSASAATAAGAEAVK